MLKSFRTEINPTPEQRIQINKTIGTCRYIYNFYLSHNKELFENGKKFMTGKAFSVWLNNKYPSGTSGIRMDSGCEFQIGKEIHGKCLYRLSALFSSSVRFSPI